MSDPIASMLTALDLTDTHARTSEDIFTATSERMATGRIFGGQVLGQSLVAAQRTIPDDRSVHSLHGYFLRPGNTTEPITFSVDRIHDGRSFSTRRSQAYQNGLPIFSMIASFQTADDGLEHQVEMPADLPQPEELSGAVELLKESGHPLAEQWSLRAFDARHVSSPIFLSVEGAKVAHQAVWLKAVSPLPDDENLHRAALAYASDYLFLEPIMRRHGVPWVTDGLKIASLDHAMWFHRYGRVDEWFLYVQESPTATGGRGLALGRLFKRDGTLMASVAQEGTIRVPTDALD
jgi:acyl-CoA thioesterase-2